RNERCATGQKATLLRPAIESGLRVGIRRQHHSAARSAGRESALCTEAVPANIAGQQDSRSAGSLRATGQAVPPAAFARVLLNSYAGLEAGRSAAFAVNSLRSAWLRS